ncbi:MAG TPA: MerR family transcriptional regulator [Acidimicrobiales bacterium]|nr:MerR family transcriptional regulator [Acidimicrobiales bacterium]
MPQPSPTDRARRPSRPGPGRTVDALAAEAGTTTRQVRALQTRGLLPHPHIDGRTGRYGPDHLQRLQAVLRLQEAGFSLAAIAALLRAWEEGRTVAEVLGLAPPPRAVPDPGSPESLDGIVIAPWRGRLLSVVPTTVLGAPSVLEEAAAS